MATGGRMVSPWCLWVHWELEQAQAIAAIRQVLTSHPEEEAAIL